MRRLQSISLFFAFAIALLVITPQHLSAQTKILYNTDSGSEVHLKVGDQLELHLKATPTTGFMWYLQKESTPIMKIIRQSQTEPDSTMPGAGVFQIFIFEARHPGDGIVLLHYVRSWKNQLPMTRNLKYM